ncbi:hypothetical protein MTO96_042803 [Rhipicephalus appendiculatus]
MASANVLRKQQDEIFALLAVTDKRHENYLELERMRHKMQPDFRKKRCTPMDPPSGGGDMASANVLRIQHDEIFALLAVTDKRHENYLEFERMRHKMQPDFRKKRYV